MRARTDRLQRSIAESGWGAALLSSPENLYYLAGFWGYIGDAAPENFGRPTLLYVPAEGDCVLITPRMEQEYARKSTWVEDIRVWVDGEGGQYGAYLADLTGSLRGLPLAIERSLITRRVLDSLREVAPAVGLVDVTDVVMDMRKVKDEAELELMRAGGRVAVAMGEGAIAAIEPGVREYEIALAAMEAGTTASAELLDASAGVDPYASPVISNLMIISSGRDITMTHKRPTMRRLRAGDSVYLCFCTTAAFKGYHITYDRQLVVGGPTREQVELHDRVLSAQAAALAALRPGATAEQVHAAARQVVEESGYRVDYRSGRGIGLSFLEPPEFKDGDTTPLQSGMTVAVDGGATQPGKYASRVGDSVLLTESGYEVLTESPRELLAVGA